MEGWGGGVYEYLILWCEGAGEVQRAVPEVLVMTGAVKIFTLNTALWDMSSREVEEKGGRGGELLYPSILAPFFLPSFISASRQTKWVSITRQCNTAERRKQRV